jgi:hypothetical protein
MSVLLSLLIALAVFVLLLIAGALWLITSALKDIESALTDKVIEPETFRSDFESIDDGKRN